MMPGMTYGAYYAVRGRIILRALVQTCEYNCSVPGGWGRAKKPLGREDRGGGCECDDCSSRTLHAVSIYLPLLCERSFRTGVRTGADGPI